VLISVSSGGGEGLRDSRMRGAPTALLTAWAIGSVADVEPSLGSNQCAQRLVNPPHFSDAAAIDASVQEAGLNREISQPVRSPGRSKHTTHCAYLA
jgi:hypothetical protein